MWSSRFPPFPGPYRLSNDRLELTWGVDLEWDNTTQAYRPGTAGFRWNFSLQINGQNYLAPARYKAQGRAMAINYSVEF